ncbi:MAG: (2Fe-2S)-binding protein [Betaproteobacteria bacterium]|nr:(2Fe-2S)-binding protein [Betaproteobacteria bacterium]
MKRREFLGSCSALGGAAITGWGALSDSWANAPPRLYARTRLVDIHGKPVRSHQLAAETNYVFHYPFTATPCLLLKLGRPVAAAAALQREDGASYAWQGGVGEQRNVVAFSAICAHKLAYPTREVSFIRYQRERSATSAAQVIHCCADHSVYDPAQGARVMSGPAPQPLAAILLEHDAQADDFYALGTVGAEQFEPFFNKYRMKLELEYGDAKARAPVDGRTVVRELAQYCKTTIQC